MYFDRHWRRKISRIVGLEISPRSSIEDTLAAVVMSCVFVSFSFSVKLCCWSEITRGRCHLPKRNKKRNGQSQWRTYRWCSIRKEMGQMTSSVRLWHRFDLFWFNLTGVDITRFFSTRKIKKKSFYENKSIDNSLTIGKSSLVDVWTLFLIKYQHWKDELFIRNWIHQM